MTMSKRVLFMDLFINPLYTNGFLLLVWYNKLRIVHCILSQSYNPIRKGPEFYTTKCCRIVCARKFAHLILKNLLFAENSLVW